MTTSPRALARKVLERVGQGGAWATLALDAELDRSGLDERDRRLASELVYGVLRNRARIDRALAAHAQLHKTPPRVLVALRVAVYQLLFLDRVPGYAAVDDAVTAAREVGGAKVAGFCNAVLRKVTTQREPALPTEPRARLAIEFSLPDWIVDELEAALAERPALALADVAAAFARQAPLVARVNARRTTREALIEQLAAAGTTATPITPSAATDQLAAPMALALAGAGDPARSPSFQAGLWTVQDLGAQLVGIAAAEAAPGATRVLDACAGVGGKSTHLVELLGDAARVDAADQSKAKLALLGETAARLGHAARITPIACDLLDPRAPLAPAYELIVLDAPCSGLGVLRRHPDAKWRVTRDDVRRLAGLQAQLLDAIAPRLAPGGALIYSVCTFTRAEGPVQARAFAARHGLRLVAEHRTFPPDADAFYLARFEP